MKGLIYRYFRNKERTDIIGCMSPANVDYVIEHNEDVPVSNLTECPNALEIVDKSVNAETRDAIREKYNIPLDKKVFVYGGNLGKPQDIKHLVACIDSQKDNEDVFFLVIGSGTEQQIMSNYAIGANPNRVRYMQMLPKEDYDTLVGACDRC